MCCFCLLSGPGHIHICSTLRKITIGEKSTFTVLDKQRCASYISISAANIWLWSLGIMAMFVAYCTMQILFTWMEISYVRVFLISKYAKSTVFESLVKPISKAIQCVNMCTSIFCPSYFVHPCTDAHEIKAISQMNNLSCHNLGQKTSNNKIKKEYSIQSNIRITSFLVHLLIVKYYFEMASVSNPFKQIMHKWQYLCVFLQVHWIKWGKAFVLCPKILPSFDNKELIVVYRVFMASAGVWFHIVFNWN